MATIAANIATIQAQAAALDTLIGQFAAAKALIDAAELDIRQQQPRANHEARSGRVRLAEYARSKMGDPSLTKTVATLASEVWSGVS
ncbi:hypothetical protein [Bradyrhizobium sp. AZCC 1708]|uniref:hypothetical protein n=1 Tax=Bradyrhizobium sp. AZCC 1708 TaxID=3117015 RepID=UPI002FF39519